MHRWTVIILAGLVAVLFVSCSKEKSGQEEAGQTTEERTADSTVVAKVNGTSITKGEIDDMGKRMLQRMEGQINPQQMAAVRDAINKQALDNLINRILLKQEIEKEGIRISKDQIDSQIEEYIKNYKSKEEFIERLESSGTTEEKFRQELENDLGIRALFAKRTENAKRIGESEARSFYDNNTERFKRGERVRASHILVKVEKEDSESVKAEKKLKITNILAQLQQGADFAEMASQYSDCPSKRNGGDLDFFERGRMVKPFEDAAFSLNIGEISDIVETEFGYHLIKVTAREAEHTTPFDEAKPGIISRLERERNQETISTYIDSLRSSAVIEYADSVSAN